jgi:hypothetical protein
LWSIWVDKCPCSFLETSAIFTFIPDQKPTNFWKCSMTAAFSFVKEANWSFKSFY